MPVAGRLLLHQVRRSERDIAIGYWHDDDLSCAGVVDCQAGSGSVELRRYPLSHPFAQLQGSDNIIAFTTQRYKNQPLIVRCGSTPCRVLQH